MHVHALPFRLAADREADWEERATRRTVQRHTCPMRISKGDQELPQTRLAFLLTLLLRGVLYGLGASALAALYASFVSQRGWDGMVSALNVAGTGLWVLAGIFVWGAFQSQGQEAGDRARVGQGTPAVALPFKDVLLALIAGSVCFGLIWVGNVLGASRG